MAVAMGMIEVRSMPLLMMVMSDGVVDGDDVSRRNETRMVWCSSDKHSSTHQ